MNPFWLLLSLWVWSVLPPEMASLAPGLEDRLAPVFKNAQAIEGAQAYSLRQFSRVLDLTRQALEAPGLAREERSYVLYLRYLAQVRVGQPDAARETLQKLFEQGIPPDLLPHASWYRAQAAAEQPELTRAGMEQILAHLQNVSTSGRFGPQAQTWTVQWLLALGQIDKACQQADQMAQHWRGKAEESEALLLLGRCLERRAQLSELSRNKEQALGQLRLAASLYREVGLWWAGLPSGRSAQQALSFLQQQGIKPGPLNTARIQDRARTTVRRFRNRRTIQLLTRVKNALDDKDPARCELDLLIAQLSPLLRNFRLAERTYRSVIRQSPDADQKARAEMGLARLMARRNLGQAIVAFLAVEQKYHGSYVAPLALYEAGELARRSGNPDSAAGAFRRCVDQYSQRPQAAHCFWGLGWLAYRKQAYSETLSWLEYLMTSPLVQGIGPVASEESVDGFPEDSAEEDSAEEEDDTASALAEEDGPSDEDEDEDTAESDAEDEERSAARWEVAEWEHPGLDRALLTQRVRYWYARSLEQRGDTDAATDNYRRLIHDHPFSYYALIAWERLGAMKQPTQDLLNPQAPAPASLAGKGAGHPEVRAALSYLRMGLGDEARTTLLALIPDELPPQDRRMASLVWQWLGDFRQSHRMAPLPWDGGLPGYPRPEIKLDARLAYPRAFSDAVEGPTRAEGVPSSLMFALIRTESAFQSQARSMARALGLTQVIRSTAIRIARALKLKGFRFQKLLMPHTAVQIGSAYLGLLLRHFEGNVVLAIASYNAGELNIHRWLCRQGEVPIDVFVEEIPFAETNRYVRNVLSSYGIYKTLYESETAPPLGLAFDISKEVIQKNPAPPQRARRSRQVKPSPRKR